LKNLTNGLSLDRFVFWLAHLVGRYRFCSPDLGSIACVDTPAMFNTTSGGGSGAMSFSKVIFVASE